MRDLGPHLSSCDQCQRAVLDALSGLALLSLASEPPPDLEQHVRARRWAAAHDRLPLPASLGEEEDIAEVGGRGVETDFPEGEQPSQDEKKKDD